MFDSPMKCSFIKTDWCLSGELAHYFAAQMG